MIVRFLVLGTSLLAAPVVAQTTSEFAEIPDVTFDYYDVSGRTPGEIRAAMLKLRPTDPNDRQRVDALSTWSWRWSWLGQAGGCDLAGATLSFAAKVQMPRLADRAIVPKRVLASWDTYVAALERHEARHVRNGYGGKAEIQAALVGATCATANDAAMTTIKQIGARDIEYDSRTRHGIADGAAF